MKFDIKKFRNDGFEIIQNIISKKDIDCFFLELNKIIKINSRKKKETFESIYRDNINRSIIYKQMQNIKSVQNIVEKVCKKLEKLNIYKKFNFVVPSINNGLIISLPNEEKNLNPLHQDIYNFYSLNFIKLWIPLTKVDRHNGSMEMFRCSHLAGYVEPVFSSPKSTYPEIDKKKIQQYESVIFDLKAGACVLFNPLTIHRSIKNSSLKTRFNIGIDIQDVCSKKDIELVNKMRVISQKRLLRRKQILN